MSAHRDISFTGRRWLRVWMCVVMLDLTGEGRRRGTGYCAGSMSLHEVLRCAGWLIQGDGVFLSHSSPRSPPLLARPGPTPTCKLFLYLGYLLPSFNGQRFFFSCATLSLHSQRNCGVWWKYVRGVIEMIHVEVDAPPLCLLSFVCWRVL